MLLRECRFVPLFVTQFLGAMNENGEVYLATISLTTFWNSW